MYGRFLVKRRVCFTETRADWRLLDAGLTRPLCDRFLQWARATLARGLPEEDEALRLIWAMTLGWKPALTNQVYEPFMRSGTMHIFAKMCYLHPNPRKNRFRCERLDCFSKTPRESSG
jgi:hypothetical protein